VKFLRYPPTLRASFKQLSGSVTSSSSPRAVTSPTPVHCERCERSCRASVHEAQSPTIIRGPLSRECRVRKLAALRQLRPGRCVYYIRNQGDRQHPQHPTRRFQPLPIAHLPLPVYRPDGQISIWLLSGFCIDCCSSPATPTAACRRRSRSRPCCHGPAALPARWCGPGGCRRKTPDTPDS